LIDTCYQVTPDRQNQRNLVDLEQGVENKSRTVRFSTLFISFVIKPSKTGNPKFIYRKLRSIFFLDIIFSQYPYDLEKYKIPLTFCHSIYYKDILKCSTLP
jgi:hypothetical protein